MPEIKGLEGHDFAVKFHLAVIGANAPSAAIALMPALILARELRVFLADANADTDAQDFNIERNNALLFAAGRALLGRKECIKRHTVGHHVIETACGKVLVRFILRRVGLHDVDPGA